MLMNESQINSVAQVCQEEAVVERMEIECGMQHEFRLNSDCGSEKTSVDQSCQATIFLNQNQVEPYSLFYVSREIYQDGKCDVGIQTDICVNNREIRSVHKKFCDKASATVKSVMNDACIGPSTSICDHNHELCFRGLDTIEDEQQLVDLAGVSFETFDLLYSRIGRLDSKNWKIDKRNRLLIFLTKLKSGLTYSALSAIFCVSRSTVSRIFLGILDHLVQATQDFVFWPKRELVQATMPECFKAHFANTRVVIDCTEFRIEIPSDLDNRVWCYSHYKHGFTGKVLIGITPSGFISFVSKVAGGRKSDSQITIDSGLIKLLEEGDTVLADKGFPDFKTIVDDSGKNILVVMPPFLEDRTEFTMQETEDTYNIASVRIHVERIMQRLRIHKILDKIPTHLFKYVDDIVHMCCVLVNLQPSIFAPSEAEEGA
ncbi:hypothetical protein QAD02_011805 [Eretmocerus hayati]|uniref:Uncharacterized protein n=1 Tax=Eretmocerus hayati TaxID=131215 RepID=A0ACC2NY65_9HYME|nr:hypothetical protein QAD02_011805 [Eretmocerus hayati]